MLKLVFAGTPDVAVPSLKAFAADPRFDVVGVITRPDAPTGRGRKLTPSPVKATALELGLPVIDLKPRSPEFMEALNDLHADIAAVIAYGNILPKNVLDAVPMGWYNLHFSNLPKWRGAAPAQRAIWAGDPTTGADVFKVGEGLDDGPIVASLTIELTGRETSGELLDRLAEEGAPMYVDALAAVGEGTATFTAHQPICRGPPWERAPPHSPRSRPRAWNMRTRSRWRTPASVGRTRPRPSTARFAPARHIPGHGPNCLRKGQSPIMTSQPLNPSPCIFSPHNRPTSPIPTLRPSFSPAS